MKYNTYFTIHTSHCILQTPLYMNSGHCILLIVPIPGPPQLFWTGPGIFFLLLLPTVSAQQASIPGQVLFSWTGPVKISCLSVKSCSLVPSTPYCTALQGTDLHCIACLCNALRFIIALNSPKLKGELLFSSVEQVTLIHVHWLRLSSKMHHILAQ